MYLLRVVKPHLPWSQERAGSKLKGPQRVVTKHVIRGNASSAPLPVHSEVYIRYTPCFPTSANLQQLRFYEIRKDGSNHKEMD